MEFEWDQRTGERNLRTHAVSFEEAVSVFHDPEELITDDPDYSFGDERFVSVGMSALGRLVLVGYAERGSKVQLIFARRATMPERFDYEES